MSSRDLPPGDDDRAIVARVREAVPEPWRAVFVLAREGEDGCIEVLTGGVRVGRAQSIILLREVLAELEGHEAKA